MGNSNTQTATNAPNHSIPMPRSHRPSLLYTSSIAQEQIDMHLDLFRSGIKILLFGSNRGKSSWFNESAQDDPLAGITFKSQAFLIDKKVSRMKVIVYDTAEQPKYFKDTLKYIPSISPNGIILTYDPHNVETINHLKNCLESIESVTSPDALMLLLGIQSRQNSTYNLLQIQEQNKDIAQDFATKNNLFHLQIDISTNDFQHTQPYIYLVRKIVKFMEKKDDSLVNMIRDLIEPSDDDADNDDMYNEESEQKELVQVGTPIDDLQKIWNDQPGSVYSASGNNTTKDKYEQEMEKLLAPQHTTTKGAPRGRGRTESFKNNLNKFAGNTTDHLDAIFEEMEHENDNASSQPVSECDSDEKFVENSPNTQHNLLPATFHRFKSHKSGNYEKDFDIDAELQKAEHQMLWERYVKKHGLPQKAEQFMTWTKKNGKTLTFVQAMNVIEDNGHVVFENIDHHKLEAARPYQLEFQDNTKAVIKSESAHMKKMSVFDGDNACQLEFERFFVETMGRARAMKYMDKFNEKCYNDIRLVDPEIFDDEWMKSDDIEMNMMDKKLFKREVQKYKDDCYKFEQRLDGIKMKEKYHKSFGNCGIMTLWSFYHHIHGISDLMKIVKNQQHARIIWKELKIDHEEDEDDGKEETPQKSPGMGPMMDIDGLSLKALSSVNIVLPESNESLSPTYLAQIEGNGERKMSDSEEYYENESESEEEAPKKIDTPSTTGSDLSLVDRNRMIKQPKKKIVKRKRQRRKKRRNNVYVEKVALKKEESISSPKLQKRKSRKRVRKKKQDQNAEMFADIMPLDDVQMLFVQKMGNRPTSVKQLLSFCQQNDIGWKFKHINKWWRNRPDIQLD